LTITGLLLHIDIYLDYVSAVVGIFIIFVAVLWLFKRKSYQGPVSFCYSRRGLLSPLMSSISDLRHHHSATGFATRSNCDTCREAFLEVCTEEHSRKMFILLANSVCDVRSRVKSARLSVRTIRRVPTFVPSASRRAARGPDHLYSCGESFALITPINIRLRGS
jgi:hypothetical protein